MIANYARCGIFAVAATLVVSACTTEYPLGVDAQSNFTYPDSTVTPIKNVTGSASDTVFGGAISVTGKMKEDAIDNALAGTPNANVLLNYNEDAKITMLMILPIVIAEYSVEGVAAEAEAK